MVNNVAHTEDVSLTWWLQPKSSTGLWSICISTKKCYILSYFIALKHSLNWSKSVIQTNYYTERLSNSVLQIVWPTLSVCVCTHNAISKSLDHHITNKIHPDALNPPAVIDVFMAPLKMFTSMDSFSEKELT